MLPVETERVLEREIQYNLANMDTSGAVKFVCGTVKFVSGTVKFVSRTVNFFSGAVKFFCGAVEFVLVSAFQRLKYTLGMHFVPELSGC